MPETLSWEFRTCLQIVEYMEVNNLYHPSHHGHRVIHNTCTTLLEVYDGLVDALEWGELSGVILIDLSTAFDCVDHQLLLRKNGGPLIWL